MHRLLTEMHEAGEPPTAPAPVIEIRFRDTRYYLLPEQIADWGLRLYSDYVQRRPPFTREMLAALLSGDDAKKNVPGADFPQNA